MAEKLDIEQLQQLQQLERIQRLQQLERLEISNNSYNEVAITTPAEETIIYLDPPYLNTAKYKSNICHDALLKWIHKQKCPVYVSSYEFEGLELVLEIKHRSILSASANNEVTERLFAYIP